jgi:hypothetical protein
MGYYTDEYPLTSYSTGLSRTVKWAPSFVSAVHAASVCLGIRADIVALGTVILAITRTSGWDTVAEVGVNSPPCGYPPWF